jgi:hypothetical protein
MVDKEGTGGEKDAMKAYRAAREETDNTAEEAEGDEASAALIERVRIFKSKYYFSLSLSLSLFSVSWYKDYRFTQHDSNYFMSFVYFRLMLCSKILKRKLMMWMLKSVIV